MHALKILVLAGFGIVVLVLPIRSQAPAGGKPSFQVATIKPDSDGDNRIAILRSPGGRFKATGDPPPPDPSGPSIFNAVQEQLGRRLDSNKRPVAALIVDSVERSSEN
jgi:hypothetical protein